jgi:hypothetical protein
MSEKSSSWTGFVPVTLVSILFVSQIIVGICLLSEVSQIEILAYVGVGLYVISGLVLGWLPVIEFRRKEEAAFIPLGLLRLEYARLCAIHNM